MEQGSKVYWKRAGANALKLAFQKSTALIVRTSEKQWTVTIYYTASYKTRGRAAPRRGSNGFNSRRECAQWAASYLGMPADTRHEFAQLPLPEVA